MIEEYKIRYSDDEKMTFSAEDARQAYLKASRQAIGRYIKTVHLKKTLVYDVSAGGFIDLLANAMDVAKSLDEEFLVGYILNSISELKIQKNGSKLMLNHNGNEFFITSYGDAGKLRKFSVDIKIEEEKKASGHEWQKNGSCGICKKDIFDVEDPDGICAE